MNDEALASLLERYAVTRDPALRDRLVESYLPLSNAVARRFSGRGAETEDLAQVAAMALVKAVERFDPSRGFRFVTYAVPTITGDVRNYLRDRAGAIRVSRDARQRLYRMQQAQEAFRNEHLREPSVAELAQAMGIAQDELLLLLDMRNQSEVVSLDAPTDDDADALGAFLGGEDAGFERMEQREWMRWVLGKVNDAEKRLLTLRFVDRLGQRETAARMGVSQMQISRMERRVLQRLRAIEQSGA